MSNSNRPQHSIALYTVEFVRQNQYIGQRSIVEYRTTHIIRLSNRLSWIYIVIVTGFQIFAYSEICIVTRSAKMHIPKICIVTAFLNMHICVICIVTSFQKMHIFAYPTFGRPGLARVGQKVKGRKRSTLLPLPFRIDALPLPFTILPVKEIP